MSVTFLSSALLAISLITNMTVESLKKILTSMNVKYSSNALAAIVSVIISIVVSFLYLSYCEITFSMKIAVEIIVLTYLSFLVSTIGYDKVVQMISQMKLPK